MTISKLGRILVLVSIVFVLANYLPDFYWLKFDKPVSKPLIGYSPVLSQFLIGGKSADGFAWKDEAGRNYSRNEWELYLPASNYRQLLYENILPDSINGEKMDLDSLRLHRISLRVGPDVISSRWIQLFPLMESQSGRVRLTMLDDFFRIDENGITFIDSKTNENDAAKSKIYTDAMLKAGFNFPSKLIAGNPSTMKPFDEGYFVIDSDNKLFHLKMVKGKPFVKYTKNPEGVNIKFIMMMENNLRNFYGIAISTDNKIYYILYDDYKFLEMPIDKYDHTMNRFVYMGDYLVRNLIIENDTATANYATDRNNKLIKAIDYKFYDGSKDAAISAFNLIFPFSLSFEEPKSGVLDIFFNHSGIQSVWGLILSAILAFIILRKRKAANGFNYFDVLIAAFTGIYGLIAIILIKNVE